MSFQCKSQKESKGVVVGQDGLTVVLPGSSESGQSWLEGNPENPELRSDADRGNLLRGLAVEDADVAEVPEVSGHRLPAPGLVHFEMRLLGEDEDLIVLLDVQLHLGGAALPIDTGDGEVVDKKKEKKNEEKKGKKKKEEEKKEKKKKKEEKKEKKKMKEEKKEKKKIFSDDSRRAGSSEVVQRRTVTMSTELDSAGRSSAFSGRERKEERHQTADDCWLHTSRPLQRSYEFKVRTAGRCGGRGEERSQECGDWLMVHGDGARRVTDKPGGVQSLGNV
ncbi:hypothetical protein EYF80_036342 [Liparis tanakae]|uniref:Uncharacterized protein n=1 Tax=Liparis tanakae TaxID=230148 RepID=A0A4Z2GL53_9TELE|nr:hypothetical protein EYF80_036342 [Liparis tanakae]